MVAPLLEGALSLNKIYRNMKKEGYDIKIMRQQIRVRRCGLFLINAKQGNVL